MNQSGHVQYGCGFCAPAGWRNYDASPTLRLERIPLVGRLYCKNRQRFPANVAYGDIVRGLPESAGSCQAVYCSHVLEHLALEDFRIALRHTRQILCDGGVFRFVLPDLECAARQYVQAQSPDAAANFLRATGFGRERRPAGFSAFLQSWLGHSAHLWAWDFKALEKELQVAGFRDIRRAEYGDAADPKFAEVEDRGRWIDSCGVECRKPHNTP